MLTYAHVRSRMLTYAHVCSFLQVYDGRAVAKGRMCADVCWRMLTHAGVCSYIQVYDGRAVAKGSTQRAHNEAKTAHQPGSRSVCIRLHTSAYVSIRQHTSAYVSIRQHTNQQGSKSPTASVSACVAYVLKQAVTCRGGATLPAHY
jgi:hypothetical protein